MRRIVFAVIMIPVILLASLPLLAAGNAAAGKKVYQQKCVLCHGEGGEGKESIAAMLKIKFVHLGSKEVQAKSDADLKKIPLEGTGQMKPVKDLNDKMAEDVVAYVRTLAKK
jgi:mono/diheme cytochrome c family protein